MIQLVKILADAIHKAVPGLKKSVYLAIIDDEGRILVKHPNENEYSFAGVHDHDDGYFYIRFRNEGKISFSEPSTSKKFTSFQNFNRIRYELTVVACMRGIEPHQLEESIRYAILNANLPSSSIFANTFVNPVESVVDPVSVVRRETPNRTKPFDKKLAFVAFDFDLGGDRDMALEQYCVEDLCATPPCAPSGGGGGGGTCADATVRNSDSSFFQLVPSGNLLILDDINVIIDIDGNIQNLTIPSMVNTTINLNWN